MPLPVITTERLILRSFTLDDASELARVINAPEIATMTLNIPYPYPAQMAVDWINGLEERYLSGANVNFAITLRSTGEMGGSIGLVINPRHQHAEMGYWLAVPLWGKGYVTEAARACLEFGFETLGLHRIFAGHYARNPASGRVMQKMGMTYEGTFRQHLLKDGVFEDNVVYGILREDWERQKR
ncbi:MAG: GNAT family N-acetyltransferase [Chloroflexi bacterium]|nr:GNAT family N-acetyltransferase [Chloroflexota bacterium]